MRSHIPGGSRGEGPSKEVSLTEIKTDSDSLPSEASGAVFMQMARPKLDLAVWVWAGNTGVK